MALDGAAVLARTGNPWAQYGDDGDYPYIWEMRRGTVVAHAFTNNAKDAAEMFQAAHGMWPQHVKTIAWGMPSPSEIDATWLNDPYA